MHAFGSLAERGRGGREREGGRERGREREGEREGRGEGGGRDRKYLKNCFLKVFINYFKK